MEGKGFKIIKLNTFSVFSFPSMFWLRKLALGALFFKF